VRLWYSETALSEIEQSLQWPADRNPSAANELSIALEQAARRLADYPHSGRITSGSGVRTSLVYKFGYRIFYEIGDAEIRVLYVRHGAREWPEGISPV
jgi:plasmid stabilization system protein ParE